MPKSPHRLDLPLGGARALALSGMHSDPQIQGHPELLFTSRVSQVVGYCQSCAGGLRILLLFIRTLLSDLKSNLQNRIHLFEMGKKSHPNRFID